MPRYFPSKRLLCLSNGHGEDIIAVRVLQALQAQANPPQIAALPLVGEGRAYQQANIPLIGAVKAMPSGGFIYMDSRQLARDLQGGLVQLTWSQLQGVRRWAQQGGTILAVGDIFPLLLAWLSGAPYTFIGTAKSEYYLRDDDSKLFTTERWDAWSESVYYPWERWLMSRDRCQGVFPRDTLTTQILQALAVPALDLGNPMMDGLEPTETRSLVLSESTAANSRRSNWDTGSATSQQALNVLLLPGSRVPEAYDNWQHILQAVAGVVEAFAAQPLMFLAAIAPTIHLEPLHDDLEAQGWALVSSVGISASRYFPDPTAHWYQKGKALLVISQQAFADCLHQADCAIAMAGTATEQFVGLSKPAITLPGKGPQFTPKFAEAQTRLLGRSIILVQDPSHVADALKSVLRNPEQLEHIAENGRRRMGAPGAAQRIATYLMQQWERRGGDSNPR
ncbi:hypothetical protein JOY44_08255 [Phormidium sp. CLA17]|uniref:lipid-A-disaccharide synthase-related protein n=1 Tax=Leptolyngbya sp. Cla-17 TaxID=2803751 RepID=UPI001490DD31|nr:lipid-A-disaccharide synthase-related protein [Leptolyngbya sp. Cla-17]MBM0741606.1 hypothetical protein [Leptolyngbya sp. Cla-17]